MKQKYFSTLVANVIIVLTLSILAGVSLADKGVIQTNSNGYEVLYNGNRESDKICLMINVYWGTEYVLKMAEIFEKYDFNTTFFVGGCWADDNVDIIKKLDEKGFEIANHGYFHKNHKEISYKQNYEEIIMTDKLLSDILKKPAVKLFAPPSGYLGTEMGKVCTEQGFKIIMWTRDTVDWRDKNADTVYNRAIKDMKAGDLILMHPTAHTLEALPKILDYIKNNKLRATTVSECLTNTMA